MNTKDIINCGLVLSIIAAISGGLIALTVSFTYPIIEARAAENEAFILKSFLPEATNFEEKQLDNGPNFFVGYHEGQIEGYVIEIQKNGYGGAVTSLIGCDADGQIIGVNVTTHSETATIGGEVFKNKEFMDQFIGKNPDSHLVYGQSIQGRTSATLSSKAVSNAVIDAMHYFADIQKAVTN